MYVAIFKGSETFENRDLSCSYLITILCESDLTTRLLQQVLNAKNHRNYGVEIGTAQV